jgi:HPt (histidine-containing phosphotransfer) domain-containing protein
MPDPVIDLEIYNNLKEMMGADYIGEVVDAYFEEVPTLLKQLKQAFADGNADVFRRSAHSIKSSSASFGAMLLAAKAKELEFIGKEGRLADQGVQEKVDHLAVDYAEVETVMRGL